MESREWTPNVESSATPPTVTPKLEQNRDGGVGCSALLGRVGFGVSYPFPKDFLCDGVMYEKITINGNEEWRVTESAAKQFQQWQKHQTQTAKCSQANEPKTQNY